MSTNVSSEAAREALRRKHGVRLVSAVEEGSAVATLPAGVYGFTASPVLASPLFANRRYRNFEVHALATGACLIGFVSPAEAAQLTQPVSDLIALKVFPDAEGEATAIVSLPYDRIAQHRQYAIRNAEAIVLQVTTETAVGV
jgi:hypothetical protein